jgi:hypothetical protein
MRTRGAAFVFNMTYSAGRRRRCQPNRHARGPRISRLLAPKNELTGAIMFDDDYAADLQGMALGQDL